MSSYQREFGTNRGVRVPFIVTDNISKPGSAPIAAVQKYCAACGRARPLFDFLTQSRTGRDGYQYVEGREGEFHQQCYRHFPAVVLQLPEPGKRLRLRFGKLRDDRGQPVDVWDRFDSRWRAMDTVGVRLMDGGKAVRFQPRKNRAQGRDGRKYGR